MMFNIDAFSERLKELMFDLKLNGTALAKAITVTDVTISRYLNKERIPTVEMLIKLADHFNVTIDYLIGMANNSFKMCPPFSRQFAFLLEYFGCTKYRLGKATHLNEETIYAWLKGKNKPSIENVLKLSVYFERPVDFVLGREN